MKVGVFTVSLPDLTPEEDVREIKDAGYDGVEWRVARVPEDVRDEEPSFWGNNLCTLAPTEADACRARRLSEEAGLGCPASAPTSVSGTWGPLRRRCASPSRQAPPGAGGSRSP